MIRRILAILTAAAMLVSGAALAEEAAVTAHDYLGEWVDLNGIRTVDITQREEGDGFLAKVHMEVYEDDQYSYQAWDYSCVWDEESRTLRSVSRATGRGEYMPGSREEITGIDFEYGDAEFFFNDESMLVWSDEGEGVDDGMVFEHTIGWVDPDYVGPGHHFVGDWNDGRVTVSVTETTQGYHVFAEGTSSAFEGCYWIYECDYDPDTDSLVTNGEMAEKYNISYGEDGEEFTQELAYDDGEASFRINEEGKLVWTDGKENAGEGRAFEKVPEPEFTGSVIEPMDPGCDLDNPGDGEYPAAFEVEALADGELTFRVYSEDVYDIVDVSRMEAGDIFRLSGLDFPVESVERADDLLINGGLDNGGFTLRAFDEDNCWKVVMENDYTTFTYRGQTTLPLSGDVTFTDGWQAGQEPAVVTGAQAAAEAISGSELDYFSPLNTTIRVENGQIVEIIRAYMP